MSKTTKITAELEIKALLSDAQAGLEAFSRSLQSTWKNGEPPKSILKLYEQLGQKLTSMQETSKKGIVDSSELSQVTADYKAFQKILHELGVNFKLLSAEKKKAFLSKEEQDAMKARADAVSKYNEVLKKNQEIRSKRQAPEGQIAQAKTARTTAEGKKVGITAEIDEKKSSVPKKTAEIEAYKAAQDSLKVVLEKIKKTEEAIANERARGTPEGEGRNNSLTRSLKNLEALKQQAADLEAISGKEAYEKYTADMKAHEEALASLQQQYADAENTIKEANETIAQAEKKLTGLDIANESEAFDTLKTTLQKLGVEGIESADNLEDLTSAIKDCDKKAYDLAEKGLQGVIDQSDKLQKSMEDVGDELDKTNASMERQKQAVADNNAFEDKIKQFLGLSGAAQLLRSALRDAIATITELDATMTEMAVVTDLTVGDYWNQLPQYSKQASDLGVSINSAYKAATLYYQQGLKGNEVTKISAETLKLAKIAGIDAADATNKMTAALRGFNMELNEASAQRVADVYSELAAITAADVDEISNAMTKTASIAHSAGMEFETTAAFLSQIVETTRESAETAGTALKTVIARFQELKKDPTEIGEVDGEIVDANKIETALRTVGVALRDSSGQFRDLDDVFMDLSKKWDGLDKNTQRYIATIAAGSRQQSRFIAMMSDYERTQELVTAANTSAGASNKQFEKTMESLEAKVEKLKNAWHEFTMGILQSDLVKVGVDILTKLLEVINKATSAFGGFGSSISKIGAILTTFKIGKSLFEKIPQSFKQAMIDVVREAIEGGKKAGEGAVEAAREGAENAKKGKKGEKPEEGADGTKKTFGEALTELKTTPKKELAKQVGKSALNATGVGDIVGGFKTGAEQREKQRQLNILDKNGGRETLETVQQGTAKALETTTKDRDAAKTKFDTASATLAQLEKEEETLNAQKPTKKKGKKKLSNEKKELEEKKKKATEDKNKAEEEYKQTEEAQKAAAEANEKATEDLQAYDDLQKDVAENGGAGWKQVSDGFDKLGSAATGAGLAVTAVGQAFIDAGAEEFGSALQSVGSVLTFIGTASSLVSTAMSILSAIFPVAGAAGAASGTATSVAWSPVTIIALAIVAALALLVIGFLAVSAIIKSFSAEEKLKKAEAAADAAAEAADRAAESYNALNEAVEELGTKYDALDGLVKGTEEWNKAVQDVNASVLDLIDKYPELAGFVESKGGVLTIDLESEEVQDVIKDYEQAAATTKAVQYAAEAKVTKAKQQTNFSNLDAVNEVSQHRGAGVGIGLTAAGVMSFNPVLAIGGLIAGAILGPIENAATHTDEKLQEATEALAMEYSENSDMTLEDMEEFLIQQGVAADEAAIMAETFASDTKSLLEFGEATKASTAALDAQYTAMAMQAQQMLNLNQYTADEQAQMLSVVDADRMKELEATRAKELEKEYQNKSNTAEFDQMKQDYATEIYGAEAKVDGNKIVDKAGNTLQEFDSEDEFAAAMASAQATKEAAAAMERVPAMIDNTTGYLYNAGLALSDGGQDAKASLQAGAAAIEKALTNSSEMTKGELKDAYALLGEGMIDENKKEDIQKEWNEMSAEDKAKYGSIEEYAKTQDAWDYKSLNDAFAKQKEIWADYGITAAEGTEEFEEQYQAALEKYEKTFTKPLDSASDTFEKADVMAEKLGVTFSDKMSAGAAQAWGTKATKIGYGATQEETVALNSGLSSVLQTLTPEEASVVMGMVNSIDPTDLGAWEKLQESIEELGYKIPQDALDNFIASGIEASKAIRKVDFSTFNDQINQTIQLLNKAKEGARNYSEDEYKSFVAANKGLEKDFVQIGDEFIYLGNSMKDLTDAVQSNTISNLEQANFVLDAQIGIANKLSDMNTINTSTSSEGELGAWLANTVYSLADEGYDIKNLGIEGLGLDTDFASLSKETLREMVEGVLSFRGSGEALQAQKDKQMRRANIAAYTTNSAEFNATQGLNKDSEWSDEHREAFLAQAIQAGVGEIYIQNYRNAMDEYEKTGDISGLEGATSMLLQAIEEMDAQEEKKEEINALLPLAEKVTEAIEKQRQDEIDQLSNLNDAVRTANDNLINKIQEQINEERAQRENDKQKQDLQDMYRQQAYLGMDTSGANALQMLDNEQAIKEAEQAYEDAMVDQAIQNLQDANDKAAEQRERQIELLQQQLDYEMENGIIADQAAQIVTDSLDEIARGKSIEDTRLNEFMREDLKQYGGMQAEDAKLAWSEMITAAIQNIEPETNNEVSGDGITGNATSGGENAGKSVTGGTAAKRSNQAAGQDAIAIDKGVQALSKARISTETDGIIDQIYSDYTSSMGLLGEKAMTKAEFKEKIGYSNNKNNKSIQILGHDDGGWDWHDIITDKEAEWGDVKIGSETIGLEVGENSHANEVSKQIRDGVGSDGVHRIGNGSLIKYGGKYYLWKTDNGGMAFEIKKNGRGWNELSKYESGGLADFTGPAWLDGTKSRPEYVLNAAQTERFFSLVDVLEGFDSKGGATEKTGDNYFDIQINVDKLESDYDVEQMANKIRRMIYEDATYRNVNSINLIR